MTSDVHPLTSVRRSLLPLVRGPLIYARRNLLLSRIEKENRSRQKLLSAAKSPDEVRKIAKEIGFNYFLHYDEQIETKRREFSSAAQHFGIEIANKMVLDVGPGTSDSLDYARDQGAAGTEFIESEPVFSRFAQTKGHQGVLADYRFKPFFPDAMLQKYDFVYSKGAICCTWVDNQLILRENGRLMGFFNFEHWVDRLQQLLKPGSGQIILTPAMGIQSERHVDKEYDLDTYYWCPDIEKYKESHFVQVLMSKGFTAHDNVPNFTQPKAFPLAFHFKNF